MAAHGHICTRCKRRIKEDEEEWIADRPYGKDCAKKIRSIFLYYKKGKPIDRRPVEVPTIDFTGSGTATAMDFMHEI